MFSNTYYVQYDAGIIGLGLVGQVLGPPAGRDPRMTLKQSYIRSIIAS